MPHSPQSYDTMPDGCLVSLKFLKKYQGKHADCSYEAQRKIVLLQIG